MFTSLEFALDGLSTQRIVLAPVSRGEVASLANELRNRSVRSGVEASVSQASATRDDSDGRGGNNPGAVFVICRSVERHADAVLAASNADAFVLVAQAGRTTRRELAIALDDARRATTARTFVALQDVAPGDYRLAPSTRSW